MNIALSYPFKNKAAILRPKLNETHLFYTVFFLKGFAFLFFGLFVCTVDA